MNKCPICGNTMGFTFGTCIKCHYNKQTGFKTVEVPVEVLAQYVPFEVTSELLIQHAKKYLVK